MTTLSRRQFLQLTSASALVVAMPARWLTSRPAAAVDISDELHVLKRLTWGPRPSDVQRIQAMGIAAYIEWQLDYAAIPDPLVDELVESDTLYSMGLEDLQAAASDYDRVISAALWNRLYRAIYSERQLYEWMVEFWTDHFNIPIPDLIAEKSYDDRNVVRRHALGNFRDLLLASAQSPAMLLYLNNASSDKEHPNENYARELMELHTLGVDGGYTEVDVVEVARVLTGWTVRAGWPGGFFFDSNRHDMGEKTVLGRTFPAGRGIEEGLQLLDFLATHPSTAHHIATKLCRRFVSDSPPDDLITSTAQVFLDTAGDITSVMRHILTSAQFMAAKGQKYRRPLEFMVAAVRAMRDGLTIHERAALVWPLEPMGQIPYNWNPPNGYPDAAGAWLNTNGLLHRWNIALQLPFLPTQEWYEELDLDLDAVLPPADESVGAMIDRAAEMILGHGLSAEDRDALVFFVSDFGDANQAASGALREDRLSGLLGLLMASPAFQWR